MKKYGPGQLGAELRARNWSRMSDEELGNAALAMTADARMCCDACPIEFPATMFAVMVADGWAKQHTFQRDEFNGGQVITCCGHFSLRHTPANTSGTRLTDPTREAHDERDGTNAG